MKVNTETKEVTQRLPPVFQTHHGWHRNKKKVRWKLDAGPPMPLHILHTVVNGHSDLDS